MSDDLISRKALIRAMEKKYDIAKETGMYPTGFSEAFIITEGIIREQPTAYDVEEVVKQIEKLNDRKNVRKLEGKGTYQYQTGVIDAIEIVKAGGKE